MVRVRGWGMYMNVLTNIEVQGIVHARRELPARLSQWLPSTLPSPFHVDLHGRGAVCFSFGKIKHEMTEPMCPSGPAITRRDTGRTCEPGIPSHLAWKLSLDYRVLPQTRQRSPFMYRFVSRLK